MARKSVQKLRISSKQGNNMIFEQRHDKINKEACAPSEHSDQPGHSPSLIRVCAVRFKDT